MTEPRTELRVVPVPLPKWSPEGIVNRISESWVSNTLFLTFFTTIWTLTVASWIILGYPWVPIIFNVVLMVLLAVSMILMDVLARTLTRLRQALAEHVDRKDRLYGLVRRWTNSRGCDGVRECASDLNHVLGDRDLPEQK